ncbi:MAG: M85 family metallopeptidase [Paraburkholderia sp.]|uniref:M85 family metallopeptidase n=1 Tax=Paraburkholderia sp. TaxID=1926495 RepID=UPI003C4A6022
MTVASASSGSSYATLDYSSQQNNPSEQTTKSQSGTQLPSSGSSSDNHPTPVSPAVSRVKRNDTDPPSPSADDYADYVQRIGQQSPLSQAQLDSLRWGTVRAVEASRSRLADPHTSDMIGNTILAALNRSPTFRALVSYGMNHGGERLDDIMYRNEYELDPELQSQNRHIGDLTIEELRMHDTDHMPMPILADSEAVHRSGGQGPYVNLNMAPNEGSPHLPEWQEGLIHELVHHLVDSDDPPEGPERQNRLGPTEILARRVAQEMGWPIGNYSAYEGPERHAYMEEHEDAAILESAERNGGHERAFFQRLGTISANHDASPDFYELEDAPIGASTHDHTYGFAPGQAVTHNHTYALLGAQPQGDLGQIEFRYGEPSLFTFAHSASSGAPGGFQSAYGASSASWETQGRFFQYGNPVDGNPHVREFDFPDGSKAVIAAHQPQFADSDRTAIEKTFTVAGASIPGAVGGFLIGGPVGAAVGAGAGAAGGGAIASTYPQDRIWQGYTLNYYNKGEVTPFYTQYMYAWDSDWNRVGLLAKQKDSSTWPDYGDGNPDGSWDWWGWKSGNAPART